jgi:hypothetical protein
LVEHLPCTQGVKSSSLLSSTEKSNSKRRVVKDIKKDKPLGVLTWVRCPNYPQKKRINTKKVLREAFFYVYLGQKVH